MRITTVLINTHFETFAVEPRHSLAFERPGRIDMQQQLLAKMSNLRKILAQDTGGHVKVLVPGSMHAPSIRLESQRKTRLTWIWIISLPA